MKQRRIEQAMVIGDKGFELVGNLKSGSNVKSVQRAHLKWPQLAGFLHQLGTERDAIDSIEDSRCRTQDAESFLRAERMTSVTASSLVARSDRFLKYRRRALVSGSTTMSFASADESR